LRTIPAQQLQVFESTVPQIDALIINRTFPVNDRGLTEGLRRRTVSPEASPMHVAGA
jgi:hypothetical protein